MRRKGAALQGGDRVTPRDQGEAEEPGGTLCPRSTSWVPWDHGACICPKPPLAPRNREKTSLSRLTLSDPNPLPFSKGARGSAEAPGRGPAQPPHAVCSLRCRKNLRNTSVGPQSRGAGGASTRDVCNKSGSLSSASVIPLPARKKRETGHQETTGRSRAGEKGSPGLSADRP